MDWIEAVLVAAAIIVLGWLLLVVFLLVHRPSRESVGPALRLVPDLVRLVRGLLADRSTPRSVRVALVVLLVYLVSPLDIIPDFVPVIGSVDDLIISGAVLRWVGRRVGVDDLRRHWTGDPAGFELLRRLLAV